MAEPHFYRCKPCGFTYSLLQPKMHGTRQTPKCPRCGSLEHAYSLQADAAYVREVYTPLASAISGAAAKPASSSLPPLDAPRCPRCDLPQIPAAEWTKSWDEACNTDTTLRQWREGMLAKWAGYCGGRDPLTCTGTAVDWRARATLAERELRGCDPVPINSGSDLNWGAVREAVKVVTKYAHDAGFVPPEGTDFHWRALRYVADAVQAISTALKFRHPGMDAVVQYRKLAQDLLTAYQAYTYDAAGSALDKLEKLDELEDRAEALGLDTKAWAR